MEILKDVNFVQAIITALLIYVAWTFRRAVNGFEASLKELHEKHGSHETRLTRVETVHSLKGCDVVQR